MVAVAEVLGERYEFLSRIAAGGMGEVWRGRDLRLQRDVAIKVLRAEHADDPDFRARLHAEAQASGALNCDCVVDVYDYGEQVDDAGRFLSYVVMELVEGDTVAALIGREGSLDPERTGRIVTDTATGLAAAARRGLVHRDIKPANLLMTEDGRVKIADFGIARAANGVAITRAGTMVGTATYVSPEQVQGQPATAASDVYGLGIVAYECLTGRPPFRGDGEIATAIARINAPAPTLPSSVPEWLSTLVLAMLEAEPGRRPTAAEIARRTAVVPAAVPVQGTPTIAFPVPLAGHPAAAETTDLDVPWSRWDRLVGYLRESPAGLIAMALLVLLAVLVPTLMSGSPSALRTARASVVAPAKSAEAVVAARQAAAARGKAATEAKDAVTKSPAPSAAGTASKKPKVGTGSKKPKPPKPTPPGQQKKHTPGNPGNGHGPGDGGPGHGAGNGPGGDGGPGGGDDD